MIESQYTEHRHRVFAPCFRAGVVAGCHYYCDLVIFNNISRIVDDERNEYLLYEINGISQNDRYYIEDDARNNEQSNQSMQMYSETVFGCTSHYYVSDQEPLIVYTSFRGITNSSAIDCTCNLQGRVLAKNFIGVCGNNAINCKFIANIPAGIYNDIIANKFNGICTGNAEYCVADVNATVEVVQSGYPDNFEEYSETMVFAGITDCDNSTVLYGNLPPLPNVLECRAQYRKRILIHNTTHHDLDPYRILSMSLHFYGLSRGIVHRSTAIYDAQIQLTHPVPLIKDHQHNLSSVLFCGVSLTGSEQVKAVYSGEIEITTRDATQLFYGISPFGDINVNHVSYKKLIYLSSKSPVSPPKTIEPYMKQTVFGVINEEYWRNSNVDTLANMVTNQGTCQYNTIEYTDIQIGTRQYTYEPGVVFINQPSVRVSFGYNVDNCIIRITNNIQTKSPNLVVKGIYSNRRGNIGLYIAGLVNDPQLEHGSGTKAYYLQFIKIVDYTILNIYGDTLELPTRYYHGLELAYPIKLFTQPVFNTTTMADENNYYQNIRIL